MISGAPKLQIAEVLRCRYGIITPDMPQDDTVVNSNKGPSTDPLGIRRVPLKSLFGGSRVT